jgi:hypothetical protein
MPWKPSDSLKHKKGLSKKEQETWAKIANSVLSSCLKDGGSQDKCEAKAIKIANSKVSESLNFRDERELNNELLKEHYEIISECMPDFYPYYPVQYLDGKNLEIKLGNEYFYNSVSSIVVNDVILPFSMGTNLPFYSNTARKIVAENFFEFINPELINFYVQEIFIVLENRGVFEFKVPSTDGKNAWMNPMYKSHFNELSFIWYTNREEGAKMGTFAYFDIEKLDVVKDGEFVFVNGIFIANKKEFRD